MKLAKKAFLLGLVVDGVAVVANVPVMITDLSTCADLGHLFLIWFTLLANIVAWFILLYGYERLDMIEKRLEKRLGRS